VLIEGGTMSRHGMRLPRARRAHVTWCSNRTADSVEPMSAAPWSRASMRGSCDGATHSRRMGFLPQSHASLAWEARLGSK